VLTYQDLVIINTCNISFTGTNDAYVTIDLGKEKFKSAVKEKAVNPEWNEECDLLVLLP
jgi:Ca2+-dependent lipid-binding protein